MPILESSISQKLFLLSRTSFVTSLDCRTRTLSPFFREKALPPYTERYTNFRLASDSSMVMVWSGDST